MAGKLDFSLAKLPKNGHDVHVSVTQISNDKGLKLFAYQSQLEEDFDGDPKCYGLINTTPLAAPHDTNLQRGLDPSDKGLGNAARPAGNCKFHLDHTNIPSDVAVFAWTSIMTAEADDPGGAFQIDPRPFLEARGWYDKYDNLQVLGPKQKGRFPIIQRSPQPGYYISTTSANTGLGTSPYDASSYADASKVPYGAWAGWWKDLGVQFGDFGLILDPGRRRATGFVFADGGTAKVGEVSSKVFNNLAPGEDPNSVNEEFFLFLVFPGSGAAVAAKDKYVKESVVQQSVSSWIKNNLDGVEDIASLLKFLACDADQGKFDLLRGGRLGAAQEQDVDANFTIIEWLLGTRGLSI